MYEEIVELPYSGVYSLHESVRLALQARFIDSVTWASRSVDSPRIELPLLVVDDWSAVGLSISQQSGKLQASIRAERKLSSLEAIQAQVSKVFSLDVYCAPYRTILDGDPVTKALGAWNPGLRPVLFPSLYEAAARTIISHRLFANQAAALIQKIALAFGEPVTVTSGRVHAFPSPQKLADMPDVQGLSAQKITQLRRLGSFVQEGGLAPEAIAKMSRDQQVRYLQNLDGIGPFSAELLLLRGIGDHDAFPLMEPKLHNAMKRLYALADDASIGLLEEMSGRWSPYRSWVGLLFRNAPQSIPEISRTTTTQDESAACAACRRHLDELTTPELLYRALFGADANVRTNNCPARLNASTTSMEENA